MTGVVQLLLGDEIDGNKLFFELNRNEGVDNMLFMVPGGRSKHRNRVTLSTRVSKT